MPRSFFERDALEVAVELLGRELVRGSVRLKITEVEAYRWPPAGADWRDSANHCFRGRTERNRPMWGPGGHAYVYLCYGLHHMLNLVTGNVGEGAAVLIRSCEPVAGLPVIRRRRGGKNGPVLLTGPGKVGAALGLDRTWNDHALFEPGGLELRATDPPGEAELLCGPRVGIDYATDEDREAPWRVALPETPWVSARKNLRPWDPRAGWAKLAGTRN